MNNTSTFIWFLLYAHHRSKHNPIPATWSHWAQHLLSPLRRLRRSKDVASQKPGNTFQPIIQDLWKLVSQAPVLTLGSFHLSLMACVGIWLWSNPSNFGAPISCYPSLTIVGGAVDFSSLALRIWSLSVYTLLLIPGFNLVPGFLFFLSLHVLYNKSRIRHPQFWTRCQHMLHAVRRTPRALRSTLRTVRRNPDNQAFLSDEESQIGDNHRPTLSADPSTHLVKPADSEVQPGNDHNPTPSQAEPIHLPPILSITSSSDIHTTFLVVGLVCLVVINVLFLVDIELTLSRNKRLQSFGEDEWGFGQILALLLLVVPLRDFVTSIIDIRRKLRAMREDLQQRFEKALRDAIQEDSLMGSLFQDFIEQGVDPNTQLDGIHVPYAVRYILTNSLQVANLSLFFSLRRIK